MRFQAEHRFLGPPGSVVEVLSDPDFYAGLKIPDLDPPELLEHRSEGDEVVLRLRYEFVGHLDPIVHRLLAHQRLSWIQELRIDQQEFRGTLDYYAESNRKLLHGGATFVLAADAGAPDAGAPDAGVTVRRLDGELVVALAGISNMAEHRIVPGLVRRLDIEAEAVNERLTVW